MKSTIRLRLSDADAHYGGGLVDGARLLALFGDAATELCILAYGDEGLFRAYQSVEFLAPVYAGDFIEIEAEVVRWGKSSLEMTFVARKVIAGALALDDQTLSRALPCMEIVCRAHGTCVVPAALQNPLPRQRHDRGRPGLCVITAAIVGAETTRAQTPFLPVTADEIAAEARRCVAAGASVIHLHVRDEEGKPTQDRDRFAHAIAKIRTATADVGGVIVQVSTGGAVGMSADERMGCLTLAQAEAPDMATLNIGSLNFGNDVFVNAPADVAAIAAGIRRAHLVPEVEIYDVGHIDILARLLKEQMVEPPLHVQFVLGIPGGLAANARNVQTLLTAMDALAVPYAWALAGVGRFQLPMAELAILRGGHVRVGLEDNIYLEKGVLAEGSGPLVARARELCERLGRRVATVAEARRLLLTADKENFIGA